MDTAHEDDRTEPFRPGDTVAIRSVNTYGTHGRAVGFAVAGRVLVDDGDLRVVATTAGSAVRNRAGRGSGPNGRLVLPDDWDGSHREATWFGSAVVRVHVVGTPWSVWRWHDGSEWEPDWYVNLETPWVRTAIGFDTQDWTLDVVATTAMGGSWTVGYKDEDELAFLTEAGFWSAAQRRRIEAAGEDAVRVAQTQVFPFDTDWASWVPDPAWPAIDLPAGWSDVAGD
jgi:hypothetical protein